MNRAKKENVVARLDKISCDDSEAAHSQADDILMELAPLEVRAAYVRLMERCDWWANA